MADYKMDADHPGVRAARGVQGVLGKGIDRIDGLAKVTGAARYGYEHPIKGDVAYGFLITAPAAKGTVTRIRYRGGKGASRRDRRDRR